MRGEIKRERQSRRRSRASRRGVDDRERGAEASRRVGETTSRREGRRLIPSRIIRETESSTRRDHKRDGEIRWRENEADETRMEPPNTNTCPIRDVSSVPKLSDVVSLITYFSFFLKPKTLTTPH